MKKDELVYIYDGSFKSLLFLIKYLFLNKIIPRNIKDLNYNATLLDETLYLGLDGNILELKKYFTNDMLNVAKDVYLSNHENKELIIYYFLLQCIKYKNEVFYMQNIKSVNLALKISKYVHREIHSFKGFLRFRELQNKVLYAVIEPENNIIEYLSMHFKKRLHEDYFIIHDKKRRILSIYDKKNFYILEEKSIKLDLNIDEEELNIQDLWKSFYKVVGIETRRNEKCRMTHMPKRYWKNMIEMEDE